MTNNTSHDKAFIETAPPSCLAMGWRRSDWLACAQGGRFNFRPDLSAKHHQFARRPRHRHVEPADVVAGQRADPRGRDLREFESLAAVQWSGP